MWNSYVAALQSGDEPAAKALFTAGSAPYLEISNIRRILETNYTLIKAERHDTYFRLHVLEERQGVQSAHFYYLVLQGNELRFEYPFFLFTANWPTIATSHLTFHVQPSLKSLYKKRDEVSVNIDTLQYEQFVAKVLQITGVQLRDNIDYYLCVDTALVGELTGVKGPVSRRIGSCVVTVRPNDFSEIAAALIRGMQEPIEFLRTSLIAYGEMERGLSSPVPWAIRNGYATISKYLSAITPDTLELILRECSDTSDIPSRLDNLGWFTGMALLSELVERDSLGRLSRLYADSRTATEFERLYRYMYQEDLLATLDRINTGYTTYLDSVEAVHTGGDRKRS